MNNKSNILETISGIAVIGFVIFIVYIYYGHKIHNQYFDHNHNYTLYAFFNDIGGINIGSDVKISGVKIGQITGVTLENYQAKITLQIADAIKLPTDSEVMIFTEGIIGNKYINVLPGISDKNFQDGDRVSRTKSAISIENIIGKVLDRISQKKSDAHEL